jgi:uncharacterized protein YbjT (DUF2867 family)
MKVILFGASGMVGQGVLRECLLAADVEAVLAIGRSALPSRHPKLQQLTRPDLFVYDDIADQFKGYDACLFCLGVSANDVDEAGYVRINHELPLAAAAALVSVNPAMTFIYVSGAGTDASEQGSTMWARVKGKTENALLELGFKAVYLFRPGLIIPLNGVESKTRAYRLFYRAFGWALRAARRVFPASIIDTEQVGLAMLQLIRNGASSSYIDNAAIHRLALDRTKSA